MCNLISMSSPVVELHGGGVLEEVLPGGREGEDVAGDPPVGHLGERVVSEAGVQTRHEGAAHRRQEYQALRRRKYGIESIKE